MPATSRATRQQIRRSVGQSLRLVWQDAGDVFSSPSETAPSKAKIIDETLAFGATDEHRGKWVLATDSNSSVETRRSIGSSPDERSITVSVPFSKTPDTGWTYELWDGELPPTTVHSYINDAITEVTRKGVVGAEASSFHTGGGILTFPLDSSWLGVREVEYRISYDGVTLATMDEAADSATSNTTVELDSADKREGIGSLKLTVAAGESSATAIANSSFAAIDLRGYDRMELWFKTSGAITASNYVIQLLQGSSVKASVSLPASNGGSWTYHPASISSPQSDSGITAVQISTGSSDGGAGVLWIDDVKVTKANADEYVTVPREFWTLSQPDRAVRLNDFRQPYARFRFTGVRKPNQLNSDSDVCEVDATYVQTYVVARHLLSMVGGEGRRSAATLTGRDMLGLAQQQRNRMSMPSNIRWLDD